MKILIADDNKGFLEEVKELLEREGHEVHTAKNGLELCDLAEFQLPDLIVTAHYIPDLNGTNACRELTENPNTKDIKKILMLDRYNAIKYMRAIDAGISAVIIKDEPARDIVQHILHHLHMID